MAEILELQEEQNIHPPAQPKSKNKTGTVPPQGAGGGDNDRDKDGSTGTETGTPSPAQGQKVYPKGVVLGKDGKPCRSCTDWRTWMSMTNKSPSQSSSTTSSSFSSSNLPTATTNPDLECPPDVTLLGRSTWTLLHTMAANYPTQPTPTQKLDMYTFITSFAKVYPCWVCADEFREWMEKPENRLDPPLPTTFASRWVRGMPGAEMGGGKAGNTAKAGENWGRGKGGGRGWGWLDSRERFGLWMCRAHNAVNEKTGKPQFDCSKWEERWRTGCGIGDEVD